MNKIERQMLIVKRDECYDFIRSQNAIKKELRDLKRIEKSKKVRDTMTRWLKESN